MQSPHRIGSLGQWLHGLLLGLAVALFAIPAPSGWARPDPSPDPEEPAPQPTPRDRTRTTNNLKMIALAMHNYHAAYNRFPSAAITDKAGKPLLSWRVALLPFLEEDALYKQFKLDEPWDSAHNKKLLAKMPAVFGLPGTKGMPENGTFYRVFTGPGTVFPTVGDKPQPGLSVVRITDGTSNTFMVVEAGKAVPWTKPDELPYEPRKPLPSLGGIFKEGFHVAMCDGSVRLFDRKAKEASLRAAITASGGEIVNLNELEVKPEKK
jgi:hypothetical protein